MRCHRFVVAILGVALSSSTIPAQQIARAAAGRPRSTAPASGAASARDSSHSLAYHVKRGATFGALGGAAMAGLAIVAISRSNGACCEQPRSHVTLRQSIGIVALGSTAGAVVGAILGYSYHFNRDP